MITFLKYEYTYIASLFIASLSMSSFLLLAGFVAAVLLMPNHLQATIVYCIIFYSINISSLFIESCHKVN